MKLKCSHNCIKLNRFRYKNKCLLFHLCRILGSLISAHILLTDPKQPFGKVNFEGYENELLHLAHDLAVRLLPAFEHTDTGIPYPRVSELSAIKTG